MHHSSSAAVSEVLTPSQNAVSIQSHSKPGAEDSKSSPQRSSAATTTTSETSDKDRGSIYTHPLFPLMALLFEKCEQATQSPDPPTSDSFDVDIEEFVNRQKREGKPFFSDDTEVDNLMIKAIQVLRIHLLELEKVNELCKDFCHRYITCLKGKMHSENLLKEERSPTSQSDEGNTAAQNITDQMHSQSHSSTMQLENQFTQTQYQTAVMNSGGQVVYTPVYPPGVVTPGLVTQAIPGAVQIQSASNAHNQMVIHGSTPLSQIGISQQPVSQSQSSMALQNMNSLGVSGDTAEVNDLLNKRKPKRGVLPKQATNIMRSWLFQHIVHPYPTEDEKRMIAAQTNLTLLQVNNWFINARRRILQPMLDASNPEAAKAKKQKTSNRPSTQRFWPQSLANLGQTTTTTQSSAGTAKTTESDSSSRSAQLSPELPQLQPPRNPLSPSSILNNSTAGSPHMVDVSVNSESESDNDSDSQAFQTS